MVKTFWFKRTSFLPRINDCDVATGIAAVNAAVDEHRGRPAFAAEHLGARGRFESIRRSGRNHQLAGAAECDDFPVSDDETARSEVGLLPLLHSGGEIEALERSLVRRI